MLTNIIRFEDWVLQIISIILRTCFIIILDASYPVTTQEFHDGLQQSPPPADPVSTSPNQAHQNHRMSRRWLTAHPALAPINPRSPSSATSPAGVASSHYTDYSNPACFADYEYPPCHRCIRPRFDCPHNGACLNGHIYTGWWPLFKSE